MTFLSYLFFLIAPVSVFIGIPLPLVLVFVVLAVIGVGKAKARKEQVTMSVRDWYRAVVAEIREHPVGYAVQLVSLWLIPAGLTLAGFIPTKIALLGAVASYFLLGRLSSVAAKSITGTQVNMLLAVIAWLGMTEDAFLEAGCQVARGADGSFNVSPVPNAALLLGAERTAGMLSTSAGAANAIPEFPAANVAPSAPTLDFSGGFNVAPVAGAGLVSEGL
ncbi:MAG: hypothetical protein HHJ14_02320 [Cellulomonas sp.]|nr:hypothetical protein [Cellulomonas sp.]